MIYDRLENLEQYTGLFAPLDTCIEWIAAHNLNELPLGKTVIDGDKVFVNVSEVDTRLSEEADFETHSNYMDIQLDLTGEELFEVALGELVEKEGYNVEKDVGFYTSALSCAGVLREDRFVIFMVEEPHKPGLRTAQCSHVKKAVFKVARD